MNTPIARLLTVSTLALALGGTLAVAHAADSAPPAPASADKLAAARSQIAAKNWAGAIDELKKVNDTASPDWNNLMGYSLRKARTPDLAGAEKFYDEALRLDPKHKGTLEYSGELSLMKGDLPTAEQRLGALNKVCGASCDETLELKKAIERYKAAGNKYVAVNW